MDTMVMNEKLLTLAEMQTIAQQATFEALKRHPRPSGGIENLTLGSEITESHGVFELYVAGDQPSDAVVVSRATVSRSTGDVNVEVFLKPQEVVGMKSNSDENRPVDKSALELAAVHLEGLLDRYAAIDSDAALLRGSLMPLIFKAKAGEIEVAMDWRKVPGAYLFNERNLRQYGDLEDAYALFKFKITAWEPVITDELRPK